MKGVISFSLYGRGLRYAAGAIQNSVSVRTFYPGWRCVFYVGDSVAASVRTQLRESGAIVTEMAGVEDASAMFWRFLALSQFRDVPVIVRDCDSRFTNRESRAVSDWLKSSRGFHIMRDHPRHDAAILGGLWGAAPGRLPDIQELVKEHPISGKYGDDQVFLERYVYPKTTGDRVVHDDIYWREIESRRFSDARNGEEFVGESYDENGDPVERDRQILREYLSSARLRAKTQIRDLIKWWVIRPCSRRNKSARYKQ